MLIPLRAECQHKLFRFLQWKFDSPYAPILLEGGHSLIFWLCKMFQDYFIYFFPSSRISHFTKKSEFLLVKKGITNKFWLLSMIIATVWHWFLADKEKIYIWVYQPLLYIHIYKYFYVIIYTYSKVNLNTHWCDQFWSITMCMILDASIFLSEDGQPNRLLPSNIHLLNCPVPVYMWFQNYWTLFHENHLYQLEFSAHIQFCFPLILQTIVISQFT